MGEIERAYELLGIKHENETVVSFDCWWCHKPFKYEQSIPRRITLTDVGMNFYERPLCLECAHVLAYRAITDIQMERSNVKIRQIAPFWKPVRLSRRDSIQTMRPTFWHWMVATGMAFVAVVGLVKIALYVWLFFRH